MTTSDRPSDPSTRGPATRRRDASATRDRILDVARRRFALSGYTATTVRDITEEVGVNVALVNRYFVTKEGLFEACLTSAVADLDPTASVVVTPSELPAALAAQLAGPQSVEHSYRLLLLLRTSGDDRTEQIRLGILERFASTLARAGGHNPLDRAAGLRAQVLLCTLLGVALLRTSTNLEPLSSADEGDLVKPLRDVVAALLAAATGP